MAQNWHLPFVGTQKANQALKTLLAESMESVRTLHSGATEPTSKVAYMWWADTTTMLLKQRNSANTDWIVRGRLDGSIRTQLAVEGWAGSLSATKTDRIGFAPFACTVLRLVISSTNDSTSSSGNEWQMQLVKRPNAAPASPVNLFSGTVGTFTALGGVGGGAEIVAHQAYVLTPNQNATLLDLDSLELTMTKVGTGTTLNGFRAHVEVQ